MEGDGAMAAEGPPVLVIEGTEEEVAEFCRLWRDAASRAGKGGGLAVLPERQGRPEWDDAGVYGEGS